MKIIENETGAETTDAVVGEGREARIVGEFDAKPAKTKKAKAPKADGLGVITADAVKDAAAVTDAGKVIKGLGLDLRSAKPAAKAKPAKAGKAKAAKPAAKGGKAAAKPAKSPAKAKAASAGAAKADAPKKESRTDQVVALLKRKGGVTVQQIMDVTKWLPHTTRAFLSAGLKKKGHTVVSEKVDGVRTYRL